MGGRGEKWASLQAVVELAAGALAVSSGRLDTTKTTGHTSDKGKHVPIE